MKRIYDKKICSEVTKCYNEGIQAIQISAKVDIPRSSVYYILKKHRVNKPTQKKLIYTQQRLARQLLINRIRNDFDHSLFAKDNQRIEFIKDSLSEYSLSVMCESLHVSKSSYYLKTRPHKKTTYELRREELTPLVSEVFYAHSETAGARTIANLLRQKGVHVAEKTVADIMHNNGWFSLRAGAKKLFDQYNQTMKNVLNREFDVASPNEVWVADVTEFMVNNKRYFLSSIMDLFSRRILAWKIGMRNTTQLIKTTFLKAYDFRKPDGTVLFHSDRGANYTSKVYVRCLFTHGIIRSVSRPKNPYDNSAKESFFKTLKSEEIYRRIYRSEKEMLESLGRFISYYNNERPHSYLGYKSPAEAERLYYEKNAK